MNLKDTKERADLVWQLNKIGTYTTHKELWDAFYALEKVVVKSDIISSVSGCSCKNKYENILQNIYSDLNNSERITKTLMKNSFHKHNSGLE